jgi:hypothetical protein
MTGSAGSYHSAEIQIDPRAAASGTTTVLWVSALGPVTVTVPPGTVDGAVIWVRVPAGDVAVTIRVAFDAGPAASPPAVGPEPAPARPAHRRQTQVLGYATLLLIALGAFFAVRVYAGGKPDATPGRVIASRPAEDVPLSAAGYRQALAAADRAIGADFATLHTDERGALLKAAPVAAETMHSAAVTLDQTLPPLAADAAHRALVTELLNLAETVRKTGSAEPDCPAASPYALLLQSDAAGGVRAAAKRLGAVDRTYVFGVFLPAAPKRTNVRLTNGTLLKRPAQQGAGELAIGNGAKDDTVVSLVPQKSKRPIATVYLRGGGNGTIANVKDGTYRIYAAAGQDWNARAKGFTRGCSFSVFDDSFAFRTTATSATKWTVTLTPAAGGNATTTDVDPGAFPAA